MNARRKFTFRTSITFAVMAFIFALAALLIAIQVRSLHLATREAASAYMDATSSKVFGRLQSEVSSVVSLLDILATSSSVADTNERSEIGPAIPLFKAALRELPQVDSIYVGFDNGAWLQVRRINELTDEQRERLRATPGAAIAISLVRPTEFRRAADAEDLRRSTRQRARPIRSVEIRLRRSHAVLVSRHESKRSVAHFLSLPGIQHWRTGHHDQHATARQGARHSCRRSQARHLQRLCADPEAGRTRHCMDIRHRRLVAGAPRFPAVRHRYADAPLPVASSRYRRYSHRGRESGVDELARWRPV